MRLDRGTMMIAGGAAVLFLLFAASAAAKSGSSTLGDQARIGDTVDVTFADTGRTFRGVIVGVQPGFITFMTQGAGGSILTAPTSAITKIVQKGL